MRRPVAYVPARMFAPRRLLATVGARADVALARSARTPRRRVRSPRPARPAPPRRSTAPPSSTASRSRRCRARATRRRRRRSASSASPLRSAERDHASSVASAARTRACSRPTRRATAAASCRDAVRRGRDGDRARARDAAHRCTSRCSYGFTVARPRPGLARPRAARTTLGPAPARSTSSRAPTCARRRRVHRPPPRRRRRGDIFLAPYGARARPGR